MVYRYDPQPPSHLLKEDYTPFSYSFVSLEGFLNAKLMVEILRRLGEQPDRDKLEDAVFTIRNFDIGIEERVSFGPDQRQGLQQVYYTVVESGRFVTLKRWEDRFAS